MQRVSSNERGVALPVAIFALVIMSALLAGTFFAGTQEHRIAENSRYLQQSFGVTEAGAYDVIRTWKPQIQNAVGIYPADSARVNQTTAPSRTGSYGGYVYKLNRNLYLVDITGSDTMSRAGRLYGGGARQRIGVLVRIRPLQVDIAASLTVRGSVKLAGTTFVDGNDHTPNGTWSSCALPDSAKAGIRTPDNTSVSGTKGQIAGNPPVLQDTSVKSSTFTQFGDVSYADLSARADITLPPGTYRTEPVVSGGVCDATVPTNWGDGINRNSECGNYFPVIHITGNVTLNGVQGQGVLLVDGDLSVQGGYEFFGIAIVRGSLKTAGGGATDAHFWGGVMAENVDLELNSLAGDATLNYSKCAIVQALEFTGVTAMLRSRSWVQLF